MRVLAEAAQNFYDSLESIWVALFLSPARTGPASKRLIGFSSTRMLRKAIPNAHLCDISTVRCLQRSDFGFAGHDRVCLSAPQSTCRWLYQERQQWPRPRGAAASLYGLWDIDAFEPCSRVGWSPLGFSGRQVLEPRQVQGYSPAQTQDQSYPYAEGRGIGSRAGALADVW